MPTQGEQEFTKWLRELGRASFNDENDEVILPQSLRCSTNEIGDLIDHAYPSFDTAHPDDYFQQRCILAPRDHEVHEINSIVLERFPGPLRDLPSVDKALDPQIPSREHSCPIETLHDITPSGFPLARLSLKAGCPIILLRDIPGIEGAFEGSRGIVTDIGKEVLQVRLLSGGMVLLPRVPHTTTDEDPDLPFHLRRRQFPVALAFAMTIEKAQGQTFSGAVGVDLRYPCFAHGQLYLALSRANRSVGIKCIVGTNAGESKTKNVVYREVLVAMSHASPHRYPYVP